MASSSSSPPVDTLPKHDVFLSFRGEDTRDNFTSHLHDALVRKKIETYIDNRLDRGAKIGPALLEAIERSKISVVIFSKDYASSTWCLDELAHILKCKERDGQIVIPVFYGVEPSHVRWQEGSYAVSFREPNVRFKDNMDKVQEWRAALKEAANTSGFDNSKKTRTESQFVEDIAEDVLTKLNRKSSSDLKGLVGIERKIGKIESLICIDSPGVCCVGIWGRGGIGKTTLADAVFHRLSSMFEASCFLPDVREGSEKHGLVHLRNVLVQEILNAQSINITSPSAPAFVRERLNRTKVLIVLDDVNDFTQLEFLVGDPPHDRLRHGSRIIITTRDRRVLKKMVADDKIYHVEELNTDDAIQLFNLHAFRNNATGTDYAELSSMVVHYAGGIPLAVKILGSLFLQCESRKDWEDDLEELKTLDNKEVQNVLRLSYDRLKENEKEVFLDIACHYKGMDRDFVEKMVRFRGLSVRGIRILVDMSLISISTSNCIEMHDMLQEIGRKIDKEQCPEAGKRVRLWDAEDVYNVLENNTGTATVQSIVLDAGATTELNLSPAAFERMDNLKLLQVREQDSGWMQSRFSSMDDTPKNPQGVQSLPNALKYLHWEKYPFTYLPSRFSGENLVELRMRGSMVAGQIWNTDQVKKLGNLKVIDLSHCLSLEYLPEMPGNLESLNLSRSAIKELPSSVWSHEKLCSLDVTFCKALENLPSNSCKLKVSGVFSLWYCTSLGKFWELPRHTTELDLSHAAITEIPTSICELKSLERLDFYGCKKLKVVPSSIYNLSRLKTLDFEECPNLKKLPPVSVDAVGLLSLQILILKRSGIRKIPDGLVSLTTLQELNLDQTRIKSIPGSIKQAVRLYHLSLSGCINLKSLAELSPSVYLLEAGWCRSLETVSSSSAALAQGWDKYEYLPPRHEKLGFPNCPKLDQNATRNIMADVQLRIMRMAAASSKYNAEKTEEAPSDLERKIRLRVLRPTIFDMEWKRSSVTARCTGDEIPNWFSHKSEGSSISIKLPHDWFSTDFLGFAQSAVVGLDCRVYGFPHSVLCKYGFQTDNGENHEIEGLQYSVERSGDQIGDSHQVFVWWNDIFVRDDRAKWSPAFYKRVIQASVHFYVRGGVNWKVERCGICLLYGTHK